MPRTVVGVDGCAGAWLAVMQEVGSKKLVPRVHASPTELVEHYAHDALIGVDVPIGLPDRGPRACDQEARRLLGRPRQSSVFPAPIRPTLEALDRITASEIGRRIDGRGVGTQACGIFPYVLAWDNLLRAREELRKRVFEVHPEVSFWAMSGGRPMSFSKKKHAGAAERRLLLNDVFGRETIDRAWRSLARCGVAVDDFHDALAALWSARRRELRTARRIPQNPPVDGCGLLMAIHY